MTGIKVIFHLGNIIQLICWVYTYLQPTLSINWSVRFTLLLKVIGVAGMHFILLSITLSDWSKPEYTKC